jgi:hypothetical protein
MTNPSIQLSTDGMPQGLFQNKTKKVMTQEQGTDTVEEGRAQYNDRNLNSDAQGTKMNTDDVLDQATARTRKKKECTSKHGKRKKKNTKGKTSSASKSSHKSKSKKRHNLKVKGSSSSRQSVPAEAGTQSSMISMTTDQYEDSAESILEDIFSSDLSYHSDAPPFVRAIAFPDDCLDMEIQQYQHRHTLQNCDFPEVLQIEDLGIIQEENGQSQLNHNTLRTSHERGRNDFEEYYRMKRCQQVAVAIFALFVLLVLFLSTKHSS